MVPQNLKFTKSHEWVRLEEDGGVTVGISEFAVTQLGDIVFLELPSVGSTITKDATFGTIESVKAAVEIYSPISGEVTAANDEVVDNFDLLAQDSFGQGWLVKTKVVDSTELDNLMSADEYEKYLQSPECQQ